MKKIVIVLFAFILCQADAKAQNTTAAKFMQITTIESVSSGGVGRSKMLITREDGTQEEREMQNLFSLAGINFKNIKDNETSIIRTLKAFIEEGWKLLSTIPLTLSTAQNGNGIFMTRYLLSKEGSK